MRSERGFTALYRGTRDGFTAAEFHSQCEGNDNTIIIVKDDSGNVFGGFVDVAWDPSCCSVSSERAFLFALKSAESNECSVVLPSPQTLCRVSMFQEECDDATSGGGYGLFIAADCNVNTESFTRRSATAQSSISFVDADRHFTVVEIDVFQCHARPAFQGVEEQCRAFESLPEHVKHYTDLLRAAMATTEEEDLLQEALLVEHLSQRPLSELKAATEAMRVDPADTCSKIERVVERMQTRLAAGENEDEIVRFNVQGDLCCIRKSTILGAAPQSQLGVRVSGRWTEQVDDLDEDGNIFIEAPRATFRKLLSYLRLEVMLGDRKEINQIVVAKEDEMGLKHLLDYFMIEAKYVIK